MILRGIDTLSKRGDYFKKFDLYPSEEGFALKGSKFFPFNPLYTEQTLPHYILEESNFRFRYIRL